MERSPLLWSAGPAAPNQCRGARMKSAPATGRVRCAIYTRVSTDQGLDQDFNSLDAQYEASSAYIQSQAHAGWAAVRTRYDDGGYSGARLTAPTCNGCWMMSDPERSTSLSSIRLIG